MNVNNLIRIGREYGFVEGKGNSTTLQNYSFTDNDLTSGKYQYRLQQIDYDGTLNYSDIVEIEFNQLPEEFEVVSEFSESI